jgi:hypothetical protein
MMTLSPDEILLRALAKYSEAFDAGKIHGWISHDQALWQALDFLRVGSNKLDELAGVRRLNATSLDRIRRWFARMHRKDINGLMLVRYRDGWCDVRQTMPVSGQPQVE